MAFFNNSFVNFNNSLVNFSNFGPVNFTHANFEASDFNVDPSVWNELEFAQTTNEHSYYQGGCNVQQQPQPHWFWQTTYQQSNAGYVSNSGPPQTEDLEITKVLIDLTGEGDTSVPDSTPISFPVAPLISTAPAPAPAPKKQRSFEWLPMSTNIETAAREYAVKLSVKVVAEAHQRRLEEEEKKKKRRGQGKVKDKSEGTAGRKRKRSDADSDGSESSSAKRVRQDDNDAAQIPSTSSATSQHQYNAEECREMERLAELFDEELSSNPPSQAQPRIQPPDEQATSSQSQYSEEELAEMVQHWDDPEKEEELKTQPMVTKQQEVQTTQHPPVEEIVDEDVLDLELKQRPHLQRPQTGLESNSDWQKEMEDYKQFAGTGASSKTTRNILGEIELQEPDAIPCLGGIEDSSLFQEDLFDI